MSTPRMTRETRVEYLAGDEVGGFRWTAPPLPGIADTWQEWGYRARTVERWVTEWTEVAE